MTSTSSPVQRAPADEPGAPTDEDWLPIRDVATRLHVLPKTVREWINRGSLPCRVLKIGNVWRVNASDLDHYLALIEAGS